MSDRSGSELSETSIRSTSTGVAASLVERAPASSQPLASSTLAVGDVEKPLAVLKGTEVGALDMHLGGEINPT